MRKRCEPHVQLCLPSGGLAYVIITTMIPSVEEELIDFDVNADADMGNTQGGLTSLTSWADADDNRTGGTRLTITPPR